jgi:hypothetical protein
MPEPTLQAAALRYAAGDLTSAESEAFEILLRDNQDARDALAEAVRLSAAALGQEPPGPDRSFRAAIRERLIGYCPAWLRRRAYRGHPATWTALGAATVAASTIIGLSLAAPEAPETAPAPIVVAAVVPAPQPRPAPVSEIALAPAPREDEVPGNPNVWEADAARSVAEIWAHLSTTDHAEKLHDTEHRWRQKLRDTTALHVSRIVPVSTLTDNHMP